MPDIIQSGSEKKFHSANQFFNAVSIVSPTVKSVSSFDQIADFTTPADSDEKIITGDITSPTVPERTATTTTTTSKFVLPEITKDGPFIYLKKPVVTDINGNALTDAVKTTDVVKSTDVSQSVTTSNEGGLLIGGGGGGGSLSSDENMVTAPGDGGYVQAASGINITGYVYPYGFIAIVIGGALAGFLVAKKYKQQSLPMFALIMSGAMAGGALAFKVKPPVKKPN